MSKTCTVSFTVFLFLILFIPAYAQTASPVPTPSPLPKKGSPPQRIYGLTIEDLKNLDIKKLADQLPVTVPITLRIVFQKNTLPSDYTAKLSELWTSKYRAKFRVMGLIFDSSTLHDYHLAPNTAHVNCDDLEQVDASYNSRAQCFVTKLDQYIDMWEVGNEVNGEWADENYDGHTIRTVSTSAYKKTIDKIDLAIDDVLPTKKPIALTVYYSTEAEWEDNVMDTWINHFSESRNKDSIDYVLVSYYEDNSDYHLLIDDDLNGIFTSLRRIFKQRQFLGMGEFGYSSGDHDSPSKNLSDECYISKNKQRCDEDSIKHRTGGKRNCRKSKTSQMQRYYGLHPSDPLYIGGGFWWNMSDDYVGLRFTAAVNAEFKCLSGEGQCTTPVAVDCP